MIDALIPTKLSVPLVRTDLVPRLRLLARLHEGVEKKLTLVSGPAGAGKTTLVAAWLSQLERVAAWLTLDSDDNEPGRFLNYLAAAVQGAGFDWRPTTDGVAAFPELISMLEAGSPLVLVLDDYHLIDNPTVHGYLTFLVDYGPNSFHLLLTSRADPPLALSRLRARGELAEIRAGDLLFSEREADTFLNEAQALNLPAPALRALYERTEGWAAGLQLAAISLRRLGPLDRPRFVTRFAGDDRFILDYLLEEIWQQQPADRQHFLRSTAVLDELNAALCAAVSQIPQPAAQAMLEALERENLFLIPLDNRRAWYRYHHLFAEFLRGRLAQQDPEERRVAHGQASAWYAAHNRLEPAIRHSLAAGQLTVVALMLSSSDLLRQATPGQILGWLDQLPAAVLDADPFLAVRQLWVLLEMGELERVASRLEMLAEPAATDPDLAIELQVIHLHLARHRGEPARVIELGRELLAGLPSPPSPKYLPARLAVAFGLAEAYRQSGDLDQARAQFGEAVHLSELVGSAAFALRARVGLADLLVREGSQEAAAAALEEILEEARPEFSEVAAAAEKLLGEIRPAADHSFEALTARELEVLRWLAREFSTAAIGEQLFISANTVKTHLKRIYAKLGARSRFEAVVIAREKRLL